MHCRWFVRKKMDLVNVISGLKEVKKVHKAFATNLLCF